MKARVTRRTFMKITGTTAVAGYVVWKFGLPEFNASAAGEGALLAETLVPTVCAQCPGACGILVRVVDGRAVKIEGNPKHPVNAGHICPKAQAGLQVLYDPDRVKGPMRRVRADPTKRGPNDTWEQIPWDRAIEEFSGHLETLRNSGKASTVVSISGRRLGHMTDVVENFMKAYGSPHAMRRGSTCGQSGEEGYWAMDGNAAHLAHDWKNSNYLLLWGYPMLEASRPLTYNIGGYAHLRRGRPVRGKVVLIDPRMGTTAGRADEWIPIKPGTDGAMALAMARVIVDEKLYDERFLREQTDAPHLVKDGAPWVKREIEEEKDGVKTKYQEYYVWDENAKAPAVWSTKTRAYEPATAKPAIVGEYEIPLEDGTTAKAKTILQTWSDEVLVAATPAWAESVTGVPSATIERLAREFASTKPGISEGGDKGTSGQTNGMWTRMAIHSLNALTGSLAGKGGIIYQKGYGSSLKAFPAIKQDDIAKEGTKVKKLGKPKSKTFPLGGNNIGYFPTAVLDDGLEVGLLMAYYTAVYFAYADSGRWRQAAEKIPYLVSFSPFWDEFASSADLVLPDHTYLERYQQQPAAESLGYPVLAVRNPVVAPVFDTMDTGDVFLRTAKRLGGTLAESFPWETSRELVDFYLSGLKPEEIEALHKDGVISKPGYKFNDYAGNFKTPTKKFEFYSLGLKGEFKKLEMTKMDVETLGIKASTAPHLYMPHYEPPRHAGGSASEYPLILNTYKLAVRGEGRTANSPHLGEVMSPLHSVKYDTWVEINPDTAAEHGIHDGTPVWVESSRGRIKVRARVFEGAEPSTLSIPHFYQGKGYGRWSEGRGANPNEIILMDFEWLTGQIAYQTRVKVYPTGDEA